MSMDLKRLLGVTRYWAFDTDGAGRILAGSDESGSTQLVEISPDGQATALTALPGACSGRYVTGERAVIVSHDEGGNERHQLSLLALPATGDDPARPATADDLQPLVRDPAYMHTLGDVASGRICYFTNRRNGVAFDPVIRDLASGAERTIALGDVMLAEAALSPDGRWLALAVESAVTANAQHVVLVDLSDEPGREQVIAVTQADDPAMNGALAWLPGSDALILSRVHRRCPVRPGDRAAHLAGHRRRGGPDRLAVPGRVAHPGRPQRERRLRAHPARRGVRRGPAGRAAARTGFRGRLDAAAAPLVVRLGGGDHDDHRGAATGRRAAGAGPHRPGPPGDVLRDWPERHRGRHPAAASDPDAGR
jgi:hypothetical protein